jgi:hypothetical protein
MIHYPAMEVHQIMPPKWVEHLVVACTGAFRPMGVLGAVGYQWFPPKTFATGIDTWVVLLYPAANELLGGEYDGERTIVGFMLNTAKIVSEFDEVGQHFWKAPVTWTDDYECPEWSCKGKVNGNEVWLRIFAHPPSDATPSLLVNPETGATSWKDPDSMSGGHDVPDET